MKKLVTSIKKARGSNWEKYQPSFRAFFVVVMIGMLVASSSCTRNEVVVSPGPPEEGFLLGPEDIVEVVVWRNPDLSREVVIRPDGLVSLPLIGDVPASGLTAEQLAAEIAERYKEYKENPSVSVHVKEVNSHFIYVVGEINTPGKITLKTYTTILQAISLAGGFTQFASRNDMQVIRKIVNNNGEHQEIRIPVRYNDLISSEGGPYNFILRSGDTIVIP